MNLTLSADRSEYARGQAVRLTLTVANEGRGPVSLRFNSGQRFDMAVFDPAGSEVWRWSRGRMFTMALGTLRLDPGAEHVYQASWQVEGGAEATLPAGRYTARGWLTSPDSSERPAMRFSVR